MLLESRWVTMSFIFNMITHSLSCYFWNRDRHMGDTKLTQNVRVLTNGTQLCVVFVFLTVGAKEEAGCIQWPELHSTAPKPAIHTRAIEMNEQLYRWKGKLRMVNFVLYHLELKITNDIKLCKIKYHYKPVVGTEVENPWSQSLYTEGDFARGCHSCFSETALVAKLP